MTIISHYDKSSSSFFIISDHWQTNCLWSLNSSMAQSLGLILLLMNVNNISPHKTRCGQLDQVFLLIDGIRNNIYRWRSVATEQVMSSATVVLQFLIFYLETLSHMKGCLLSAVSATIHTTLHFTLTATFYHLLARAWARCCLGCSTGARHGNSEDRSPADTQSFTKAAITAFCLEH